MFGIVFDTMISDIFSLSHWQLNFEGGGHQKLSPKNHRRLRLRVKNLESSYPCRSYTLFTAKCTYLIRHGLTTKGETRRM